MPSHRMNSGTQAIDGMARTACNEGSSSRRIVVLAPVSVPISVPATAPNRKPSATRAMVAATWVCSSPLRISAIAVTASLDGGGISRPEA